MQGRITVRSHRARRAIEHSHFIDRRSRASLQLLAIAQGAAERGRRHLVLPRPRSCNTGVPQVPPGLVSIAWGSGGAACGWCLKGDSLCCRSAPPLVVRPFVPCLCPCVDFGQGCGFVGASYWGVAKPCAAWTHCSATVAGEHGALKSMHILHSLSTRHTPLARHILT